MTFCICNVAASLDDTLTFCRPEADADTERSEVEVEAEAEGSMHFVFPSHDCLPDADVERSETEADAEDLP